MATINEFSEQLAQSLHHLYFIYDFEKKEVYKFGISDKPINSNNSSARLGEQIRLYNQVTGSPRFSGKILIKSIKGRHKARIMEDDAVLKYAKKLEYFNPFCLIVAIYHIIVNFT
ncbi:MAG: hypothetical protein AAF849_04615 [Bacteroidota bacterium]